MIEKDNEVIVKPVNNTLTNNEEAYRQQLLKHIPYYPIPGLWEELAKHFEEQNDQSR